MKFNEKILSLYAVTDRTWCGQNQELFLEQIEQSLKGGVTCLQLREKNMCFDAFVDEAFKVKSLCKKYGVPFFINDNVEVALAVKSDGIHIGQHDMSVKEARKLVGNSMILGVSAQTVEQALQACRDGADYLGVGAVFSTSTKLDADSVSYETLRAICASASVPVVAIGGISQDNLKKLKGSGIAGIAVVSAIYAQKDILNASRTLLTSVRQDLLEQNPGLIRGVIFDVDGTILDSMPWWVNSDEIYLKKLGIETKERFHSIFFEMTIEESSKYLKEKFCLKYSENEIMQLILGCAKDFYYNEVQLKNGIIEALEFYKACKIPMIVATAGEKDFVEHAFKRLGISEYFSGIITTTQIGCGKNNPDIFMECCKLLGTVPSQTLVVEDALHAIKTAKKEGFVTAGVYESSNEAFQNGIEKESDFYFEDTAKLKVQRKKMHTALTIAGSDSSGGAGIQADIKTMTVNGIFAMSVITALTAQNTTGVQEIFDVPENFIASQLDSVFTDIFPDSVKIGMVSKAQTVHAIAEKLKFYGAKNIVVDPVMVSTSGCQLICDEAVEALEKELFPIATLITPNIPEAQKLCGFEIKSKSDMEKAAREISSKFGCSVLLKGGHSVSDANDFLYEKNRDTFGCWFYGQRIDNPNTHGTGCTLSSAIASNLAKGYDLESSVRNAKEYLSGALSDMLDLGKGAGPMNHAFFLD